MSDQSDYLSDERKAALRREISPSTEIENSEVLALLDEIADLRQRAGDAENDAYMRAMADGERLTEYRERIRTLWAENERLREALRMISTHNPGDGQCDNGYSPRHVAREALARDGGEQDLRCDRCGKPVAGTAHCRMEVGGEQRATHDSCLLSEQPDSGAAEALDDLHDIITSYGFRTQMTSEHRERMDADLACARRALRQRVPEWHRPRAEGGPDACEFHGHPFVVCATFGDGACQEVRIAARDEVDGSEWWADISEAVALPSIRAIAQADGEDEG